MALKGDVFLAEKELIDPALSYVHSHDISVALIENVFGYNSHLKIGLSVWR